MFHLKIFQSYKRNMIELKERILNKLRNVQSRTILRERVEINNEHIIASEKKRKRKYEEENRKLQETFHEESQMRSLISKSEINAVPMYKELEVADSIDVKYFKEDFGSPSLKENVFLNSILSTKKSSSDRPSKYELGNYEPKTKIPVFSFEPTFPGDFTIPSWANENVNDRLKIQNHTELKLYFQSDWDINEYINTVFPGRDIPSSPNKFSKFFKKYGRK